MIIVQKFGGASIANTTNITQAVSKVQTEIMAGNKVVVIVSAMQGITKQLISFCNELSPVSNPMVRAEYDTALSSGETLSSALFALALQQQSIKARSLQSWQIPIFTSDDYTKATIIDVNSQLIMDLLLQNIVPVISGFQGIDNTHRITTLGRSGSDITAVAIATALQAARCDLYKDVEGVFAIDPSLIKNTTKYDTIDYMQMFELASSGAKVIHSRAVQLAMRYNIPIHIMSSFNSNKGTTIKNYVNRMEQSQVKAITYNKNIICINIYLYNNKNFDYIVQCVTQKSISIEQIIGANGSDNICIIASLSDLRVITELFNELKQNNVINDYKIDRNIASIALVGYSLNNIKQSTLNKIITVVNTLNSTILTIITSDIKISVMLNTSNIETIVMKLHQQLVESKSCSDIIEDKISPCQRVIK